MGEIWTAGQQAEGWPDGWINLGYTTDDEPFTAPPVSVRESPTVTFTVTVNGLHILPCKTCRAPICFPLPASWRVDLIAIAEEPHRPPTRYITPHLPDCSSPRLNGDETGPDGRTIMRQLTLDGPSVVDLNLEGW